MRIRVDDLLLPQITRWGLLACGIAAMACAYGMTWWLARAADNLAAEDTRKLAQSIVAGWSERTEVSVYDSRGHRGVDHARCGSPAQDGGLGP